LLSAGVLELCWIVKDSWLLSTAFFTSEPDATILGLMALSEATKAKAMASNDLHVIFHTSFF